MRASIFKIAFLIQFIFSATLWARNETPDYSIHIFGAYSTMFAHAGDLGYPKGKAQGVKKLQYSKDFITTFVLEFDHYLGINQVAFVEYLSNFELDDALVDFAKLSLGYKYYPFHLGTPVKHFDSLHHLTMISKFSLYGGVEAGTTRLVNRVAEIQKGKKYSAASDTLSVGALTGLEIPFEMVGINMKATYSFLYSPSDGNVYSGYSIFGGVYRHF